MFLRHLQSQFWLDCGPTFGQVLELWEKTWGEGLRKGPDRPFSQALSPGVSPKLRNMPESLPKIKPELALEVMQNIRNPYQMEDNKAPPSAAPPRGQRASRRPLGFCCLPFGKDFLCFASLPEPILA